MRFAVMGRCLQYDGYGMQTLLLGLLRGICEVNDKHEILLFVDPTQKLQDDQLFSQLESIRVNPSTSTKAGKLYWDHVSVGNTCRKYGVDALYAPAHIRPLYSPIPVVVSVFDMMYHLFPDHWSWSDRVYFQTMVSWLTSRAARISALSVNTKRDILHYLEYPEERIDVIYPGVPDGFERLAPNQKEIIREKYQLERPVVLYVGGFHPRKNLAVMIEAFESLAMEIPHELVILGPQEWKNEKIISRLDTSSVADRIRRLGLVPRSELPLFYNLSEVFVFPSAYEGFGFPVLEALSCGCPTITTNSSSLPEVAGEAAIYVRPNDPQDLSNKLRRVLDDSELRASLGEKGIFQAEKFSWKLAARKTLALLEDAAQPVNGA